MSELARSARAVVGAALVVVLVATAAIVVKASYGALSDRYPLTAYFPRAGQGLNPASQVQYRGVTVGQVSAITLVDRRARVDMRIDRSFAVPVGAVATVAPKNVFGEETVNLSFPPGAPGPRLRAGGVIRTTVVSEEFNQLLAALDPLLNRINGHDLATVISQLSIASAGLGPSIRAGLIEGTRLADLFDTTLSAQIRALDSFTRLSQVVAPVIPSINSISASNNLALPRFNAEAAAYQRLLSAFTPLADELAAYLADYRPDLAALLVQGVNVNRVLIARQADIAAVVHGLYRYLFKFASGAGPEVLPDGTKFAYFKTFVLFSDVNNLVCSLLAPTQPGLSGLGPLQQILTGPGSPFNCSAQFAAFARAQVGPPPAGSALAGATRAAQSAANAIGSIVGQPDRSSSNSLGQVLGNLFGTGGP